MTIRNYEIDGLKAQKHLALGITLGLVSEFVRPTGRYHAIVDNRKNINVNYKWKCRKISQGWSVAYSAARNYY